MSLDKIPSQSSQIGEQTPSIKMEASLAVEGSNVPEDDKQEKRGHIMENVPTNFSEKEKAHFYDLSKQLSTKLRVIEQNAEFVVWPGTDLAKRKTVFVCLYQGVMLKTIHKFFDIDICYKDADTPSRPLNPPDTMPYDKEMNLSHEEAELLQRAINEHGDDLFKLHSNLEAVTGSSFMLSWRKGCIQCLTVVLYCRVKGVAPIGEGPFPATLMVGDESTEIKVDVREGYFRPGMYQQSIYSPTDWHDELRMGTSIGVEGIYQGTLGPFVKLNNNDIGFVTCAHVILPDPRDQSLLQQCVGCKVYQPADGESHHTRERIRDERYCGEVSKIVFNPQISTFRNCPSKTVGVDAALVTIKGRRKVDVRSFPFITDSDLKHAGFNPPDQPMFGYGSIKYPLNFEDVQSSRVIKYGKKTGLTMGTLLLEGTMIKIEDASLPVHEADKEKVVMKGQYIVERKGKPIFLERGDSGAGVFVLDKANNLSCIGLAIGFLDEWSTVVTPIEYVLDALELELDAMKFEEDMDT